MEISIRELREELLNPSIDHMSHQELIEEKARLERSQSGNPNEEAWTPKLFSRLEKVRAKLNQGRNGDNTLTNNDIDQMGSQELIEEKARLERSQSGNPNEETWNPKLFSRLEKVRAKLRTL